MNMLESPLEAVAFNYVSFRIFTTVNNPLTWVAVITAAVSFWRIKTQVKPASQPRNDRNTSGPQPVPEISPDESCVEPAASAPAPATASPSVCDDKDVDWVTKGKFTLYYCEEEEKEVDGEITVVKAWQDEFSDECGEWWERMTRVRRVEMGWHGYQDLTVVNGNIVRLWDECRKREKYYSSSCVVW